MQNTRLWTGAALLFAALTEASAAENDAAIAVIKAVRREGVGNEEAAVRWKELVRSGPGALTTIFHSFDGVDPVVANWLRTAINAICENELAAGRKLPARQFETFLKDTKRDPRARTFALDWLMAIDNDSRNRLLPGMIDDPSAGVRREAIAHAMDLGDAKGALSDAERRAHFQKLFVSARDVDQVEEIAKKIKSLGGDEPSVLNHLGLITRWELAGPFDNTGMKAFSESLPKVESWKEWATAHPRAMVELYQALGKKKGVENDKKDAIYALARTVIESPIEREVEIRAGTKNAVKIYVNGKEIFGRDEYHHGYKLDQHKAKATLKAGKNEIMLKVLQDDRTFNWTVEWEFQCRVCDSIGGTVPLKVLTAPNATPMKPVEPKKEKK